MKTILTCSSAGARVPCLHPIPASERKMARDPVTSEMSVINTYNWELLAHWKRDLMSAKHPYFTYPDPRRGCRIQENPEQNK